MIVGLRDDLRLALDRVAFAHRLVVEPDPWQGKLLRSDALRILLNCSRQSGKSTTAGILALHRALFYPGSLVLVLAPALRQSQELFSKMAGFYRTLGRPVAPQAERRLSLELENGSRIVTLPGTEKTVRGFSGAALLLVDEAARVDDELYYAVRPMLAVSGGSLLMLSTPYGKRGVFFEEWTSGVGWERYEVPATECPRISEHFLEEERRALPARIYRQEYECSFEETEDQVFAYEDVEAAISPEVSPLFGVDNMTNLFHYYLGLDLGQARDYSAISLIEEPVWIDPARAWELELGSEEASWRSPAELRPEQAEKALYLPYRRGRPGLPTLSVRHLERFELGTRYPKVIERVRELIHSAPLKGKRVVGLVDKTGVGASVVDSFFEAGLQPAAVTIHGGSSVSLERDGYRVPKRDLVSAVQVLLQNGRLKIAGGLPLAETLRKELLNFRVKIDPNTAHDSYSHWREGDHDDLVLATAMACWFRQWYMRYLDAADARRQVRGA